METRQLDQHNEPRNNERLTWVKPELRRLEISLDTLAEPKQPIKIGSAADGFFGVGFPQT